MSVRAVNASVNDMAIAIRKVGKEFNLTPTQIREEVNSALRISTASDFFTKNDGLSKKGYMGVLGNLELFGLPADTTIKDYTRVFLARMYELPPKAKNSLILLAKRTGIKIPEKPPCPKPRVIR